jgi:hypothetical protein
VDDQTSGYINLIKKESKMTDDFTPSDGQVASGAVVAQTQEMTPELQANLKFAEVVQDPKVSQLVKACSLWKQVLETVPTCEDEQTYQYALDLMGTLKEAIKMKEALRKEKVAFPTHYTRLVNDMFRPLGDGLMKVKDHLSKITSAYYNKKAAEAEAERKKQQEEYEAKLAEGKVDDAPVEDGLVEVGMPDGPAAPPTTVQTSSGAKVQMREELVVEIDDELKLLKAIVSNAKGNQLYTTDLVEFKMSKIRELCTGRRKIPGVTWAREKRAR